MSNLSTLTFSPRSPRANIPWRGPPVAESAANRPARWVWLGRAPFVEVEQFQGRLRDQILSEGGPETLILCEHDPVVTLGRRGRPEHLLISPEALRDRGVDVAQSSRGGEVTYHGPGALVGYPIFRLRRGVLAHVTGMAAAICKALSSLGISSRWSREHPGVWVGEEKICSFGVHVRHRVTIGGFSLNVFDRALDHFSAIVPCGAPTVRLTSMERHTRAMPSMKALVHVVAQAFSEAFSLDLEEISARQLGRQGEEE